MQQPEQMDARPTRVQHRPRFGGQAARESQDRQCGNKKCEPQENNNSDLLNMECASDCWPKCGDGTCAKGENLLCSADCVAVVCGDGICSAATESGWTCPIDCSPPCGNNICEKGENYVKCPWDCGYCGDNVCSANERLVLPGIPMIPVCLLDCTPACGNGLCEQSETLKSCPLDCNSVGAK